MNFIDAVKAMLAGRRARRESMNRYYLIEEPMSGIMLERDDHKYTNGISVNDVLAGDWTVDK